MTRTLALAALLAFSPALADAARARNVVIISIDALRADHLGCYGYYRDTSPNIDAFAKESVLFKHSISQSPHTAESIPSAMTGRYPHAHPIQFIGRPLMVATTMEPRCPDIAQLLKAEGYRTAFISDNLAVFMFIRGLSRGFDAFVQRERDDFDGITRWSLDWMRRNRNRRFFLWAHYLGAHVRYDVGMSSSLAVPQREADRKVPLARDSSERWDVIPLEAQLDGQDSLNYYRNGYDGRVRLSDHHVGALLKGMKELGLDKNTLVVLTADHGEELGEHRMFCNHSALSLWETSLWVPLLLHFPGGEHGGRVVETTVGTVDIVPTLADYLGIEPPRSGFDGVSLMPRVRGESAEGRAVFSEAGNRVAATSDRWKLRYFSLNALKDWLFTLDLRELPEVHEYALYDLERDKTEQNDLFTSTASVPAQLLKAMREFVADARRSSEAKLVDFAKEPARTRPAKDGEGDARKLKSLGYMQ